MIYKFLFILCLYLSFSDLALSESIGQEAPNCHAINMVNQDKLNISNYQNKVVYLDFWASWCPPCKQSFPALNRLHNELKSKGFEVIAINLDEDKEEALSFLQDHPVDFSIFHDAEGKCPEAYAVSAMPSSYIIDKNGVIQKMHLGFHDDSETEIRNIVTALLNE